MELYNQRQIKFNLNKKTFNIENKRKLIDKIDSNYSELFQLIRKNINELNSNSFYKTRDLLVVKLAFYAGLKTSEIASLNWSDIDMKNRVINIRIKNSNYIMPMHLEIKNEIESYLNNSDNNNKAVVISNRNNRISIRTIQKMIKKYSSNDLTLNKIRNIFKKEIFRLTSNKKLGEEIINHKTN
nr:site-specific integrase [Natroniella sulfidigena]